MKRLVIAAVFIAVFAAGLPVFAQNNIPKDKSSEYYYVNITLEKVYLHRSGYVIQYRKGINRIGRAYLPMGWFTDAASKAEIINLPPGNAWPSMAVFYKDGEFSHLRLYVHRSQSHQTWGIIPSVVNLDSEFDNVETLDISYR